MNKTTTEICQQVTGYIIEALDQGNIPWFKPWTTHSIEGLPSNYDSKNEYHGSNIFTLNAIQMAKGYLFNKWVTYKGAMNLGGHVSKGEKGYTIVFWKFIEKTKVLENGEEETKTIPFLRTHTVFNVEQCENIPMPEKPKKKTGRKLQPLKEAQHVIDNYYKKESVELVVKESNRAFYSPSQDMVVVPTMDQCVAKCKDRGLTTAEGKAHYYSTLFHETAHSTGHKSRLARKGIMDLNFFGSHEYTKEELVAEMSAVSLCHVTGVDTASVIENTKAYCAGWSDKLKREPKWIVWAGSRVEKAVDYILDK